VAAGTAGCVTIPFYSSRLGGRPIGRTPDSESGYPGSSPGLPAKSVFPVNIGHGRSPACLVIQHSSYELKLSQRPADDGMMKMNACFYHSTPSWLVILFLQLLFGVPYL
jgi:hypothetical protein